MRFDASACVRARFRMVIVGDKVIELVGQEPLAYPQRFCEAHAVLT